MKKITKGKLELTKETIRALAGNQLGEIRGGLSFVNCNTVTTCTSLSGNCSYVSREPNTVC